MDNIICYCHSVTKQTILDAINNGAKTVQQIGEITGAGKGNNCKEMNPTKSCCIPEIKKLLGENTNNKTQCCCC